MTDFKTLYSQLDEMKISDYHMILMHSSLRAVGDFEGRGEGLLQAMIDYTSAHRMIFCVPTHTWRNVKYASERPTLVMNDPETSIGTFPSLAVKHQAGLRTRNPSHSMVLFGDRAECEEYAKRDDEGMTGTTPDGCYGALARKGGAVLLVGVGQDKNTYLHAVEEMFGVPNRYSEKLYPCRVVLADGEEVSHPIYAHHAEGIRDVSANFPKFEPAFRKYGCIRDGYVGEAKTQLCDCAGMRDVLGRILRRANGKELLADDTPLDEALYN